MYERSREFLSTHVAGFEHWYGFEVADKLRPGKELQLAAEPENPYDTNAVEVYCDGVKIGYVPARRNATLAQLLFFGHNIFTVHVQSVDWTEHPEHQVRMTIHLRDAR